MTDYVYKCVAAPRRAKKTREHRAPADALVAAFEAAIAEQAAAGWEYLRTDLVPMEAKAGWMGPTTETHQGVMVFRKPVGGSARPETGEAWTRPEPMLGRPRAETRPERPAPASSAAPAPEVPRLGAARIE